jgi:hypothetical protein
MARDAGLAPVESREWRKRVEAEIIADVPTIAD